MHNARGDLELVELGHAAPVLPVSLEQRAQLAPGQIAALSREQASARLAFVVDAATHAGSNGWAQESDRAWLLVEAVALRNGEHLSVEGDAALHGRLEQVRDAATVAWRQQRALLRAQSVAMRWKAKTFAKKRAW